MRVNEKLMTPRRELNEDQVRAIPRTFKMTTVIYCTFGEPDLNFPALTRDADYQKCMDIFRKWFAYDRSEDQNYSVAL